MADPGLQAQGISVLPPPPAQVQAEHHAPPT